MLNVEMFEKKFSSLINANQNYATIADVNDGLVFTEGPIWSKTGNYLTFSDIAGNKMYRYNGKNVSVFVRYSYMGNGNAYDMEGNIVTCEHATSRLVRRNDDGTGYQILASKIGNKELNSPNDVIVRSDGTVYFTDPHFGRNDSQNGVGRDMQLSFCAVYSYKDGVLLAESFDMQDPNGLCFTKNEQKLYVNDSSKNQIRRYDVNKNGHLKNGMLFATTKGDGIGHPDGMKLDEYENVWLCAQGGVHIYAPDGTKLGRIVFPVQTGNLCFGGKDGDELFVCATNRVYKIKTLVRGLAFV